LVSGIPAGAGKNDILFYSVEKLSSVPNSNNGFEKNEVIQKTLHLHEILLLLPILKLNSVYFIYKKSSV